MLLLMMELKGRFNSKMIKKAKFGNVYFDEMGGFQSLEKDKVTGGVSLFHKPNQRMLTHQFRTGYYPYHAYLEAITRPSSQADATHFCKT